MANKMPIVVSHYTRATGYEQEIEHLKETLESLKLDYEFEAISTLGSWRANSNYCAMQVQHALKCRPNRDILRVDADARFNSRPILFEDPSFDADVAACIYDFSYRPNEMLGGTLFFRNNTNTCALVDQWAWLACESDRKSERNGDLLQELVLTTPLKFMSLPPEYCKIFDKMEDCGPAVIEHFQASRRFKRAVNGMKSDAK